MYQALFEAVKHLLTKSFIESYKVGPVNIYIL